MALLDKEDLAVRPEDGLAVGTFCVQIGDVAVIQMPVCAVKR